MHSVDESIANSSVLFPCAAVLALAASFVLVTRLERVAGRWHLSEATLGLIVALAADSPEISSAVTASIRRQATIGAGVVVGSNVFNLAALLGLGAIVARRISLHRKVVILEGVTGSWVAIVTVLASTSILPSGVALGLVLVAVLPYVAISGVTPSRLRKMGLPDRVVRWIGRAVAEEEEELSSAIRATTAKPIDFVVAGICLAVVVVASIVMEHAAQNIGQRFGLSALVIGGVVLAAVTSLPNAVGAIVLASRGLGSAVLSEAMNSNMLNIVLGLFLPGMFIGLARPTSGSTFVVAFYAGLTLICLSIALVRRGLSRLDGFVIVGGYAVFVTVTSLLR